MIEDNPFAIKRPIEVADMKIVVRQTFGRALAFFILLNWTCVKMRELEIIISNYLVAFLFIVFFLLLVERIIHRVGEALSIRRPGKIIDAAFCVRDFFRLAAILAGQPNIIFLSSARR